MKMRGPHAAVEGAVLVEVVGAVEVGQMALAEVASATSVMSLATGRVTARTEMGEEIEVEAVGVEAEEVEERGLEVVPEDAAGDDKDRPWPERSALQPGPSWAGGILNVTAPHTVYICIAWHGSVVSSGKSPLGSAYQCWLTSPVRERPVR